ncbi:MAG: YwaF family protein [Clostridia bacterium]|nr:YwaF family protein [Clostridia bacterium]
MSFFKSAIEWLATTTDNVPPSFGLHHLLYVMLFVVGTFLLCHFFKDSSDKTMRKISLIAWIFLVLLEIGNQLVFTADAGWSYRWNYFPFQLCSTPLYVLPFIAFMKNSKLRDAMMAFMSTFAFFGGLVVFIYPNDVFCNLVFVNHKTMLHHGLQLLMGVFYFVYNRKKVDLKYFVRAICVFAVLSAIAILINEIGYATIVKNDPDQTINMFYFSRFYKNHLPILAPISEAVHPLLFIAIYLVGFTGVGLLIQYMMIGIYKLAKKLTPAKNDKA